MKLKNELPFYLIKQSSQLMHELCFTKYKGSSLYWTIEPVVKNLTEFFFKTDFRNGLRYLEL